MCLRLITDRQLSINSFVTLRIKPPHRGDAP